jgi:hypothetical protein
MFPKFKSEINKKRYEILNWSCENQNLKLQNTLLSLYFRIIARCYCIYFRIVAAFFNNYSPSHPCKIIDVLDINFRDQFA